MTSSGAGAGLEIGDRPLASATSIPPSVLPGTSSPYKPAGSASGPQAGRLASESDRMLASPAFTVAAYLNRALDLGGGDFAGSESGASRPVPALPSGAGAGGSLLQSRMAELALLLQMQTQTCHDEIGRIGAELRAILPRCGGDVKRLERGLVDMKEDSRALLRDAVAGQASRGGEKAIETLSTLHSLQSNLERTRRILGAASSWDVTMTSVPGLLSNQNLTEAVAALTALESGERNLEGMPGRQERSDAIARIRGQIEVLLKPQLLHALKNMNSRLGPLQQCVSMYLQLGKIDGLADEYVRQRPAHIQTEWFNFVPPRPPVSAPVAERSGTQSNPDDFGFEDGDRKEPQREEGSATGTTAAFAGAFLAFLPGWYSSILALLAEEQRRAGAIFGYDLAPKIMVRVLGECFRPIASSFKARLVSMCPPDVGRSDDGWSLDPLCKAYEATIQFFSQAYELFDGFDRGRSWGGQEGQFPSTAGAIAMTPAELYGLAKSTFVDIASPFVTYQRDFLKLEKKNCGILSKAASREIQAAVGGRDVGSNLVSLQRAVDRLRALAPSPIPLAEASMGRFQLLCCGFYPDEAVATVDSLLAAHAAELAIAIGTLRTNLTVDENRLADAFDEDHVQCSLDIVKIAGLVQQDLASICVKLYSALQNSMNLMEKTGADNHVPDTLDVADIGFIVSRTVFGEKKIDTSVTKLRRLVQSTEAKGGLFSKANEALSRLAQTCHVFVFDVCSAVPIRSLRDMSNLTAWRQNAGADDALSYGVLPQQYITDVGEHMLGLVQAIEPFASDPNALALADSVMEGTKDVATQFWRDLGAAIGGVDAQSDEVVGMFVNYERLKEHLSGFDVGNVDDIDAETSFVSEGVDSQTATTVFTNKWLDAIGLAVTGYLLERTLRIHYLSERGSEQLAADLQYLGNVFAALGVDGHPHPLLAHCMRLIETAPEALDVKIMTKDANSSISRAIHGLEVKIGMIRGVSA